jgi:hypothetical protein
MSAVCDWSKTVAIGGSDLNTGGCLREWAALLKLPDIENGQRLDCCLMLKMDRGFSRCTGFTIRVVLCLPLYRSGRG